MSLKYTYNKIIQIYFKHKKVLSCLLFDHIKQNTTNLRRALISNYFGGVSRGGAPIPCRCEVD